MKRQRISEREKVEAEEKAERHREQLLADLQAREAARRLAGQPPASPLLASEQDPGEGAPS